MPETPLVVSYLFVLFLSISYRHQEVTAVNHHWRLPGLSRSFWGLGGVPMPNPQDHAQEMHHLPEYGVPGI